MGSSSPKEPPLQALTEPDVNLSVHPALIIQPMTKRLCFTQRLLPSLVDLSIKLDTAAPSLQFHYRTFFTTPGCSAPVSRLGTLALMGASPLCFSLSIRKQVPTFHP